MRTMPAKSRSTAPTGNSPIGERQMDDMFRHQVNEGIKRNKPTVSAREEFVVKMENMVGQGVPVMGGKHG